MQAWLSLLPSQHPTIEPRHISYPKAVYVRVPPHWSLWPRTLVAPIAQLPDLPVMDHCCGSILGATQQGVRDNRQHAWDGTHANANARARKTTDLPRCTHCVHDPPRDCAAHVDAARGPLRLRRLRARVATALGDGGRGAGPLADVV